MFALMAFAENQLGETYCNRIPFSTLDGGNGLNSVTAGDPRVPTTLQGRNAFDSQTPLITTSLWGRDDPVTVGAGLLDIRRRPPSG